MSKTKTKLALAMIVKPTDQEAELLSRALNTIANHVDGIFITITGKNKKCEEVAKMYGAEISHFDWINDFAAARNFNFKQVPKHFTHIIWQDADDLIRGANKIKKVIKDNSDVDGFTLPYLYWFENNIPTVVHLKTQIVKNDGCVEWAGQLHEDFKQNRQMNIKFVEGIERLHVTDVTRVNENAQRNLEISIDQVKKYPNDPRSFWNLGNCYKSVGKTKEAMEAFDTFLGTSRSEDEKYIVFIRMAECYLSEKNFIKALEAAKLAIGTKPEYPDAYYTRGNVQFEMNDFMAAKDSYKMGLEKKPPVLQIIVYNPRDYDYIPLKNLARIYVNLNRFTEALTCLEQAFKIMPDDKDTENLVKLIKGEADRMEEAIKIVDDLAKAGKKLELKKALDALSDDMKSHPIICQIRNQNFVKAESTGKDLVFYCGPTGEDWTPAMAKEKGIGGSEEAVINLAAGLVKRGWNVTVYNSCGFKEQNFDGVIYKPFWMWNVNDKQDVTVIWRSPKPVDYAINSKKIYIDVHDAIGAGEFNDARLEKIDKIMVKSKAHRDLYPTVPDNKFMIVPNGVDLSLFDVHPIPVKNPYLIANFSSPDRGLMGIMDVFEEAYKRVSPDIKKKMKLAWYYGWHNFDIIRIAPHEKQWAESVKNRFEALKEKGLATGGTRLNHADVAKANLEAGCMLYPSEFYEIDWIGGSKAQIAGMWPITTNFAAIGEKIHYGVKIKSQKTIENWANIPGCDFSIVDPKQKEMFVNALVDYLQRCEDLEPERIEMANWARYEFDQDKITDTWHEQLSAL